MRHEELDKLLGGYATGTLTAQERALLFEAALADQALFNALADEQALKELLDNPHARQRLLAALRAQASRPSLPRRLLAGLLPPPAVRAVAGGLAVAVLAVTTVTRLLDIVPPPPKVSEDSFRTGSARGRALEDKLKARKENPAPKKAERQEPIAAPEKAVREVDTTQNKEAEQRAAAPEASPASEARVEVPAAAPPPAAQPQAEKKPAASPPDSPARADVAKPREPGARDLFYGAKRKDETAQGAVREADAPAMDQPSAGSGAFSGLSQGEQVAGALVRRLGLRYGLVPRDEGPALVIGVNQRGYLYAAARDATGATVLIYPVFSADPRAALVEPGPHYFIPPTGALSAARLTLILSRTPLGDPTAQAASKPSGETGAVLRQETKEPPLEGLRGPTVYVVEAALAASSLSIEIVVPPR